MAVYNTSTVTVTVGSQTIKGNSYTEFNTYVTPNDLFHITDTEVFYTVAAVNTASRVTLSARYADTDNQTSRSENIASTNNATKCYSGTLSYSPVIQNDLVINASNIRYTDNGAGVLTGTPVIGTPVGTIDYDTGAWTIITATTYAASVNVTASYYSGDELTSQSYQIVRDFTPNYSMPEMSLNDTNFPNIYTNALRTIDRELKELEDSLVGSVLNMTVTNNASVFGILTASDLVVKHTASILTLENVTGHITTLTSNDINATSGTIDTLDSTTGHITTLTSNSITATSLTASGLDIVAHVNNAASDPHNSVDNTAYDSTWNGSTDTAPSRNTVYDKIEFVNASINTVDGSLTAHIEDTSTHGVTGTILGAEDVDDTPVNGETNVPISSNWAYDHENALDPHTSYLLADGTRDGASSQTQNFGENGIAANIVTATIVNISSTLTINSAYTFPTSDGAASQCLTTDGNGNIVFENKGAGDGEANTATNLGTSTGTVYKTKDGVVLQFRRIAANSAKVAVSVTATDVKLDVAEAQLDISNMNQVGHVATLTTSNITATNLIAGGLTYPTSDGSASQCLTTDGNGNIVFENKGAGGGPAMLPFSRSTTDDGIMATSTSYQTVATYQIYIPEDHANYIYIKPELSGYPSGTVYCRFVVDTSTSSAISHSTDTYAWKSEGSCDVSGVSSGWTTLSVQIKSSPATNGFIRGFSFRWGA